MRCFRKRVAYNVAQALGLRQRIVSADRLEAAVEAAVGADRAPAVA
jgi:hypothetical protein